MRLGHVVFAWRYRCAGISICFTSAARAAAASAATRSTACRFLKLRLQRLWLSIDVSPITRPSCMHTRAGESSLRRNSISYVADGGGACSLSEALSLDTMAGATPTACASAACVNVLPAALASNTCLASTLTVPLSVYVRTPDSSR